jgi:hypothetical protein
VYITSPETPSFSLSCSNLIGLLDFNMLTEIFLLGGGSVRSENFH